MSQEEEKKQIENIKFISSQEMDQSEIQQRAINLGRNLIQELELNSSVDTLSKWMVFYISEQIATAENATGEEKAKAKQECFNTILKLWTRRPYLPEGSRPFEDYERIFQVLKKLDPETDPKSFYQLKNFDRVKEEKELESEASYWIETIELVNNSAKNLLRFCLIQAYEKTKSDNLKEWLKNEIQSVPSYDIKSLNILDKSYKSLNVPEKELRGKRNNEKYNKLLDESELMIKNLKEFQSKIKTKIEDNDNDPKSK